MNTTNPSVVALLAATLTLSAPATAQTWYEHYDEAEKAAKATDWAKAVDELNQAIEVRSESGTRVRSYGMNFDPYFPYLKLGVAHFHLGNLDAAMQAFEIEEQYGAIQDGGNADARRASAELRRFRSMVEEARRAAGEAEKQRIARIVEQSLGEASDLERQGRLEEAIQALGRGQAVDPESADVNAAVERIRTALGERQAREDRVRRAAALLEDGRTLLAAGRYSEASRQFRQALQLGNGEAQALFDEAQTRLRAELEQQQDAQDRQRLVSEALGKARQLSDAGQLAEALDSLEDVIALDPENREAATLQQRLLTARAEAEAESFRDASIEQLLAAARTGLAAGRAQEALATANQVLGLDPGNLTALGFRSRAFQQISRALLGSGTVENLPPAVDFVDFRQAAGDGTAREVVSEPEFRLSGMVFDNSAVDDIAVTVEPLGAVAVTTEAQDLGDDFYITTFRLQVHLPAGLSVFRVVATDPEGLTSRGEYEVVFERPWHRSPVFFAALAAAFLALAGTLVWRRARRRKRRLERRFNPYVAGAPVLDENLFFGRQALVDRILQTVHNNSLLLYGERRIGKTSLQHHLKKRLGELRDPQYDFYPVYVDLQGTPEEKFFATLGEDVFLELAPHLDGLEATEHEAYGYRELVRDLRQVIKTLAAKSDKTVKLVLLIDEVDELNDYDPKINQKLRSLFMKSFAEHLAAVVSGVAIKRQWEREGSPWYNFFEEIEVKPLRDEAARELVERPIHGLFKLEDGLAERIIEMTGNRPYLIQKMLISLVNKLYEEGRREITLADVEAVGRPETPSGSPL